MSDALQQQTTGGDDAAYQKGLGLLRPGAGESADLQERKLNLLHEDLSLPVAVLQESRVRSNLVWMRDFMRQYGVLLAPHGKTTMSPRLFALQLEYGAWGITVATAHQAAIAYHHGVRRVLMANQLVGKGNMAIISELLRDPAFEFFCLVDSPELVAQLGSYFRGRGQTLQVLLELGVDGGRTGARDAAQVKAVVDELGDWEDCLRFCGVEVYEGVLKAESEVRDFLRRAVAVTAAVQQQRAQPGTRFILSGAGSAWYDVVAEIFAPAAKELDLDVVLRPGCYVTTDAGIYRSAQDRIAHNNPVASSMAGTLEPALQLWAYVQAVPEPQLAIIGLGKRDVAFDAGLPLPALHYRPGWPRPVPAPAAWTMTKLMDQHGYLSVPRKSELRVGDMVSFDISHPCLTFDKWRYIPIINAQYEVVELAATFF